MIWTWLVCGVTCAEWNWMIVSRCRMKLRLHDSLQVTQNSSPVNPINSGWNCTEGLNWPCYKDVTLDAKLNFEKHFRSVSRAAAQTLGIMRKSSQIFYDRSLLLRSLCCFVLLVLEYFSALWCAAQLPTQNLNCWTELSGVIVFLAGGVLEGSLAHSQSVAGQAFYLRSRVTRCINWAWYHEKVLATITRVIAPSEIFLVRHTPFWVLWRWDRRLELFRSTSVPFWQGQP